MAIFAPEEVKIDPLELLLEFTHRQGVKLNNFLSQFMLFFWGKGGVVELIPNEVFGKICVVKVILKYGKENF